MCQPVKIYVVAVDGGDFYFGPPFQTRLLPFLFTEVLLTICPYAFLTIW